MRITPSTVQKLADHAATLSGNHFSMSVGGDIGHGTRYIANHRMLVWLGRGANVQAASFYFGVIEAYNDGTVGDLPAWVCLISRELVTRSGYEKWHNEGLDAGMHYRHRQSRTDQS